MRFFEYDPDVVAAHYADRYPELLLFPSAADALGVLNAWWRRQLRTGLFWLAVAVFIAALAGSGAVAALAQRRWLPDAGFPLAVPVNVVLGVGGTFVLSRLWRRRTRRHLRTELVTRGVPVCVPCGYDLRGLPEPRCPECGAAFDPRLRGPARAG